MQCPDGHDMPESARFCAVCGAARPNTRSDVAVGPPAGWYPDPSGAPAQRYLTGEGWSTGPSTAVDMGGSPRLARRDKGPLSVRTKSLLILGVVVLIVAVGGTIALATRGNGSAARGGSATDASVPAFPMMNSLATRSDVIASLRSDYCGGNFSQIPDAGPGYEMVMCYGPSGGPYISQFDVFTDPGALQLALNSGAVQCTSASTGSVAVLGPTWAANIGDPSDAEWLIANGASSGTCK